MGAAQPSVVLDASAAIALFVAEPAAAHVRRLLAERPLRMSVVNAAETIDILVRRYRRDPDEVVTRVEQLLSTGVTVQASIDDAIQAGELRARLFDRRSRRLSLADCFVLATAEDGDSVVTTDATLAAAARDEGIDVVEL